MFYIIALVGGFIVALGTAAVIGGQKASRLPGGSFAAGIAAGVSYSTTTPEVGYPAVIICGFLGVVGWLIFKILRHRLNQS